MPLPPLRRPLQGRSLLHIVLMLALAIPPAIRSPAAPANPPDPAAAAPAPGVPFVYVSTEAPRQLTAEQSALVLRAAQEGKPRDRDLWFIAVVFNDGKYECWSFAYYTPEERGPRLRKGRYADIHLAMESEVTPQAKVVFGKNWKLSWKRDGEWAQVSPAGQPFAAGEGKPAVPPPAYIPFPRPLYPKALQRNQPAKPLADDELVRLVDFARSQFHKAARANVVDAKAAGVSEEELRGIVEKELERSLKESGGADGGGPDRRQLKEKILQQMGLSEPGDPICSVVVAGDGRIGIAAGVSDWSGNYLHVTRADSGEYTVTRSGMWNDADTIWWPEPGDK